MKNSRILAENKFRKSVDQVDSIENQRIFLHQRGLEVLKRFQRDLNDISSDIGPIIEIGAERAQRGMYLKENMGINCHSIDISFPSLKSAIF